MVVSGFGDASIGSLHFVFYLFHTTELTSVNWVNGLLATVGAVIFMRAGNLFGDYYDYVNEVDKDKKTGEVPMLVSGHFQSKTILFWRLSLTVGIILGYTLCQSGLSLLIIGLIGTLCAVFYYKLKYIALG